MDKQQEKNKQITLALLLVAALLIVAVVGYDVWRWSESRVAGAQNEILAESGVVRKVDNERIFFKHPVTGQEGSWQKLKSIKYLKQELASGKYLEARSDDLKEKVMITATFANNEDQRNGVPAIISISPLVTEGIVKSFTEGVLAIEKTYINGEVEKFDVSVDESTLIMKTDVTTGMTEQAKAEDIKPELNVRLKTDYSLVNNYLHAVTIEIMTQNTSE